jgi:hypothetical protein
MSSRVGLVVASFAAVWLAGCGALPGDVKSSSTTERAKVEQVLRVEDAGHIFVEYVVTWHGQRVVVSDPLSRSRHQVGEEIEFIVHHMALGDDGPKTINFTLLDLCHTCSN